MTCRATGSDSKTRESEPKRFAATFRRHRFRGRDAPDSAPRWTPRTAEPGIARRLARRPAHCRRSCACAAPPAIVWRLRHDRSGVRYQSRRSALRRRIRSGTPEPPARDPDTGRKRASRPRATECRALPNAAVGRGSPGDTARVRGSACRDELRRRASCAAVRSPPAGWPCRPTLSSPGRRTTREAWDCPWLAGPCRDSWRRSRRRSPRSRPDRSPA